MKFSSPQSISALVLSTALAACGGTSTTTTTTTTFTDPLQANGLPFASNQIVETSSLTGLTIQTDSSRLAFQSGSTLSQDNSPVELTVVDADTIELTSGSETWTLNLTSNVNSSGDSIWIAQRGIDGNPSNLSATFGQTDLSNPNSPRSIFFGNIQELPDILPATDLAGNTFLISGFETDPAEITALSSSVNYQGEALITSDRTSAGTPQLLLDGTMDITVDYGAGNAVSGTIEGTASGFGGGNLVVNLANTNISTGNNGFTTTFNRSAASTSTGVTAISGDVTGTLFGADAGEMGLILSNGTASTSSGSVSAAGFALGIQQ